MASPLLKKADKMLLPTPASVTSRASLRRGRSLTSGKIAVKASLRQKSVGTLVDRARKRFVHVRGVSEKKMFGSIAFMVRGKMCVTARAERIMCRISPEFYEAALKRRGCEAVVMRGRKYRGYVYVRAESMKTERALKYWVDLALDYNKAIANK